MERRSGRARQDVAKTPAPRSSNSLRKGAGGSKSEPRPSQPVVTPHQMVVPDSEVPVVASEEVVLNRRGMPARQRKRNRLYFDDDMITPDKWGAAIAKNARKVKEEPVDDEESEEDEEEELVPDVTVSAPKANARGKSVGAGGRGSPMRQSPVKTTPKPEPPSPTKVSKKATGRNTAPEKGPGQRGGRQQQHTMEMMIISPDKRGSRTIKVTTGKQKDFVPQIKPDPDGPRAQPFPKKPIEQDRWGKLVQRANKLNKDREERAAAAEKRNTGPGGKKKGQRDSEKATNLEIYQQEGFERKSPKKEPGSPQQDKERERVQKEKEKKQAILKEKEQERTKERLQKEKEKKSAQKEKDKEKKREQRESISVLPPLLKLSSRGSYITSDDPLHQSQTLSPQQFMAVIKIDETTAQVIDKRIAHDISIRLRNLLKLPKAHKWVCYEWFYSNIDKVLFEGENDFQICLKESFPGMKARKLTRTEWTKIRRLMGKPRRCSQAFFDEEREELSRRRAKIRQIQQRKVTDFSYKELPDEIPLQLVIGTKVTARLRRPQDGLFTGTIEGVDTSNNTYRITFDRPGLGTHSIPDYEVLSNDPPETVSTSSFALKIPRRSGGFTVGTFKFQNPALLGDQPEGFPKSPFPADGMLGGFPIRLLDMIVRLSKLLKAKREKIMTLKELNVEAEKMKSYGRPYNTEYRTRYARCVLDLDSMNKEMGMYLEGIQTYCLEITNDHGSTVQMIIPEHVLDSSRQEASMVVSTYNCKANRTLVHNQKIVGLVHHLTSLLLQVRALSTSDRNLYELKSLKDTIRDIKATLEGKNLQCFQNKVEIPVNRVIAGLCVSQPKAY